MLKDLVRGRLIAAADEIFGLFERTIASYEEQLCRAKEENERQRRQLEDVCNTPTALHNQSLFTKGIQFCGSSNLNKQEWLQVKEEEEAAQPPPVKEEEEEADIGKFTLAVVSVEGDIDEDQASKRSRLRRHRLNEDQCRGPATDEPVVPRSHDDIQDTSDTDGGGEKESTHNEPTSQTCRSPHPPNERLRCPVCGRGFPYESVLKIHMQKHTGEKTFLCSLCGKSYSYRYNLNVHMKKHTGEKAFCCPVCGKCFTRKENWTLHMRTHTGEKPFSCSVCGKTFLHKSNMVTHLRKHTGENL